MCSKKKYIQYIEWGHLFIITKLVFLYHKTNSANYCIRKRKEKETDFCTFFTKQALEVTKFAKQVNLLIIYYPLNSDLQEETEIVKYLFRHTDFYIDKHIGRRMRNKEKDEHTGVERCKQCDRCLT